MRVVRQGVGLLHHVPVAVDGDPVQPVPAGTQQPHVPVQVHQGSRAQADGRIHAFHHLRGLRRQRRPFPAPLGADLPVAVVFVADAPVPHSVRPGVPVPHAQPGEFPFLFQVAVLDPVAHPLRRARARVGADVGLAADFPAERHELVRPEGVWLLHAPCFVKHGRPARAHALFPVIGGDEAAARPADDGRADLPQGLQHVRPEPVRVREGGAGVIDAAVDLAVKMLQEMPVQQRAGRGRDPVRGEDNAHRGLFLYDDAGMVPLNTRYHRGKPLSRKGEGGPSGPPSLKPWRSSLSGDSIPPVRTFESLM